MDLDKARAAIREEGLDGWLFYNFHHRDRIADGILCRDSAQHNSRAWFYAVPVDGMPLKIVHSIESGALDGLDGEKVAYSSRASLQASLQRLAGKTWGMHYSKTITVISTLDYGTAMTLIDSGLRLAPADGLIQRFLGVLDEAAIASHENAAKLLYGIVDRTWGLIKKRYAARVEVNEKEIQTFILSEFARLGLITDHPPIVACGPNSGDPHYEPGDDSRIFSEGDIVQLDMWAKLGEPGSAYADISWIGCFGPRPRPEAIAAFDALVAARDLAVSSIAERMRGAGSASGEEVDRLVRDSLISAGYGDAIKHRTGHGIDTECHGSGANIDSVEFPDPRKLVEGSCFSIEPGLYFKSFGLRTEIDVLIRDGAPVVTGGSPQLRILTCER
jgi:Xaa-Pro aminopeptidase